MFAMPSDHPWRPQDAPRSRLETLEPGFPASVNWKESRPAPRSTGTHGASPGQAPPPMSPLEVLTHRARCAPPRAACPGPLTPATAEPRPPAP